MNYQAEYITLKAKHSRVKAIYDMKLEKLNREILELRAMINNPIKPPQFDMEMSDLIKLISSVTNIFTADIISHKRHREIIIARALFCYIARTHLKKPFKRIGAFLNRDHSTIIHLVNNYEDYLKLKFKEESEFYQMAMDRISC